MLSSEKMCIAVCPLGLLYPLSGAVTVKIIGVIKCQIIVCIIHFMISCEKVEFWRHFSEVFEVHD